MLKKSRLSSRARKVGNWLFKDLEKKILVYLLPRVPSWIETYHLTYATLGWILLALIGGYLAQFNLNYLCLISLAIVGQYITDLLDGAVGRSRNTGLVKWGFYADHFFDYLFLASILVSYWMITAPEVRYIILATLLLSSAYVIHSILYFGATGRFEISSLGIGPSEIRLVFVLINTMLAFFDRLMFTNFLYLYFWASALFLIFAVIRTQKVLWYADLKQLRRNKET